MEELKLFEEIVALKKAGQGGVLATVVESSGSTPRKAGAKMLVRENGSTVGTVGGGAVEARTLERAREVLLNARPSILELSLTEEQGLTCGGRVRVYLDPLEPIPQLLVVGRGHIARALEAIAPLSGFSVMLLDPPDPESEDISLQRRLGELQEGRSSFVIVAAPSHHQDFRGAEAALKSGACFVGVVGSRRKRKAMERFLLERGCDPAAVKAVASPVGLEIGAQTPAEIALSILAQLVERYRGPGTQVVGHRAGRRPLEAHGAQQAPAPPGE